MQAVSSSLHWNTNVSGVSITSQPGAGEKFNGSATKDKRALEKCHWEKNNPNYEDRKKPKTKIDEWEGKEIEGDWGLRNQQGTEVRRTRPASETLAKRQRKTVVTKSGTIL